MLERLLPPVPPLGLLVAAVRPLPVLDRQPGQLDTRVNAELAGDLPQMGGNRMHAQVHLLRDLLIAHPLRDQGRDGALGLGEAVPPVAWLLPGAQWRRRTRATSLAALA